VLQERHQSSNPLVHRAENGEADAVRRATAAYIKELDAFKLRDYFHTAGLKAVQNGDGGAAWVLRGVVNRPESYGDHIKNFAESALYDNPRYLDYFPAEFTEAIAGRIG
jgi:hypothetical protein